MVDQGCGLDVPWIVGPRRSRYLQHVLPEISFDREIATDAAIALALGVFGLHRILRTCVKRSDDESVQWRLGWTMKIAVMVLLLFGTSIASIGIIHQIAWLSREPKVVLMEGGMSHQTRELSDLKQVGLALRQAASDNGGKFPNTLEQLYPTYLDSRKMLFVRPLENDPPQRIVYFAGHSDSEDANVIILASPRLYDSSRGRRRAVVYADDSAKVILDTDYEKAIQSQQGSVPAGK
jgi:hypothetical protein